MSKYAIDEKVYKVDEYILSHLYPANDEQLLQYGNDTYFCGCSKHLKNEYKDSCIEKVKNWVERNGGRFAIKSDRIRQNVLVKKDGKRYREDRDGKVVQIIFPCYNKRNMKDLMASLFYK